MPTRRPSCSEPRRHPEVRILRPACGSSSPCQKWQLGGKRLWTYAGRAEPVILGHRGGWRVEALEMEEPWAVAAAQQGACPSADLAHIPVAPWTSWQRGLLGRQGLPARLASFRALRGCRHLARPHNGGSHRLLQALVALGQRLWDPTQASGVRPWAHSRSCRSSPAPAPATAPAMAPTPSARCGPTPKQAPAGRAAPRRRCSVSQSVPSAP